jgi:hypothetical protein
MTGDPLFDRKFDDWYWCNSFIKTRFT